jgi:hypothetical protein
MSKIAASLVVCLLAIANVISAQDAKTPDRRKTSDSKMSGTGRLALDWIEAAKNAGKIATPKPLGNCEDSNLRCFPNAPTGGLGGTQAEVSIAVDSTRQHVVIGFNDFRGFSRDPLSISGFMYSDDGGVTFTDGGQLPSPGNETLFGQKWPQIFGDPDVQYLGGCNFIYSSLLIRVSGNSLVQTLGIHRSTDCGHSWTGPIEVPPATNPNGLVDPQGNPLDSADKELMHVDPDTGRVLIAWSNFTPAVTGGVEISMTYSDDIVAANPTFAARRVIASSIADGQGASIQAAGNGSPNVYIAWTRFPGFYTRRIAFSRSTDNGATWSAPFELTTSFIGMDQVLGNDRSNEYPTLAVDNSPGPFKGNIYVVYSNNNSLDGADVSFLRSTNGGLTFSPPISINSRPGNDRPQWFPFATVDKTTGRLHVFYYDQGVDKSGHLTEVSHLYSNDGGTTWSAPAPLTDRPFKAGWGNDTSQPNLGDYNHAVADMGTFFAAYAATQPQRFTDGQPSTQLNTPDIFFSKVAEAEARLSLRLENVSFSDSGGDGNLDPGETASFKLAVTNTDTNPLHAVLISGITAALSSSTPGVAITQPSSVYPNLAPGATAQNSTNYVLSLASGFIPGTPIELKLDITAASGKLTLQHTQTSGTYLTTTLLSQNFNAGAPGWTVSHGAGANSIPWTISNTFCGTSPKLFHQNANDGPTGGSPSRWERIFSPAVTIPTEAQWVEVEFDVCYDTEDDPNLRYQAYDGFFLRVTDLTPGRILRSVLAEAFEEEFTSGTIKHYPKHLPRNDDPNYFQDMSAWAGFSAEPAHVRIRFPGMAGSNVQFRFEYTQDSTVICSDVRPGHTCGVSVDNFVVRSLRPIAPATVNLTLQAQLSRDANNNIVATVTVTNIGTAPATNARLTSAVLGSTAATNPIPNLGTISPGGSALATLVFPASAGTAGTALVLRLSGAYDGSLFGGSLRVTIP